MKTDGEQLVKKADVRIVIAAPYLGLIDASQFYIRPGKILGRNVAQDSPGISKQALHSLIPVWRVMPLS